MNDITSGTIQITGLAELERKLRELPERLAKNAMRNAVRAGAVAIQKEARNQCPVSAEQHYLGKGARRILIKPGSLKKRGIKVKQVSRKRSDYALTFEVYYSKRYWYGKFVEAGTSKMAAAAPLRKGFDIAKEAATVAIKEKLAAEIERAASKL